MLIFHRFPSVDEADSFAETVRQLTGRKVEVYTHADAAGAVALFPYELVAPVVLVQRHENLSGERRLTELATRYCGTFAGT